MGFTSRLRTSNQPQPGRRRPSAPLLFAALLLAGFVPHGRLFGDDRPADKGGEAPRVASRSADNASSRAGRADPDDPVAEAKRAIAACKAKFARVRDYTCTFHKREQIDGKLTSPHVMHMKARTAPTSFYLKFQSPNKGREAIYVAGRHKGKVLAHDVGIGRLLAGTMHLDPVGEMAMEDCRHPVTEAGIGALIETVATRWDDELKAGESLVTHHPGVTIGAHACSMIETIHPSRQPHFLFHKVRLYIDREHGLPIRFEAYDWPKKAGAAPELVEEYTYLDLKLNVGLGDKDFDPDNKAYAFGRF